MCVCVRARACVCVCVWGGRVAARWSLKVEYTRRTYHGFITEDRKVVSPVHPFLDVLPSARRLILQAQSESEHASVATLKVSVHHMHHEIGRHSDRGRNY